MKFPALDPDISSFTHANPKALKASDGMRSDNDNADVPAIYVAPVVLVMAIEVFNHHFEVEAEASFHQRYHALRSLQTLPCGPME
jgi:hypothetical protein